ncbi:DUF4190 domain-containing protein [Kribbella sp. NBC_01245]|uniref:DUF4190 domain-containing protein n=1 Tax=Kribbella sp. NBC_01245 TaxID=2903578 RepID=UPI002E27BD92|nr:DUF4190 domain-containing protein [Kribbella sp. NBC_01245]
MTQPPRPPRTEPYAGSGVDPLARSGRWAGRRALPSAETWVDGVSAEPPTPVRPTDTFSMAGFVLSIAGAVVLSVPLALFGLRRTRRTGLRGRNLALAGLVISACWLVIFGVIAGFVVLADREAGLGQAVPVEELRVAQCFNADLAQGALLVARIADCAQPHTGEAYARAKAKLTGLSPDDKADTATRACASSFETFVGRRYEDSELDMYYVVLEDRAVADGNVLCMVGTPGEQLTGSMRGSRR